MKKKLITLILSSISLLACSNIKNDGAIYNLKVANDLPVELEASSVDYLLDNHFSFTLLCYTSDCLTCIEAKNNIDQYIKESHSLIYEIEMNVRARNYLIEEQSSLFSQSSTYPVLFIINEGILNYTIRATDLTNYTSLTRKINNNLYDTTATYINDLESYQTYIRKNQNYLLFTYDSSSLTANSVFEKYIYPRLNNSNKNICIIDKNTANSPLITLISDNYQLSIESEFDILSIIENGQIKTTVDYLSCGGEDITILLDSFFNINSIHSSR